MLIQKLERSAVFTVEKEKYSGSFFQVKRV